jgi:ABC-type bacteriocin/lantibiotic exporter with double-glycine peptidase domain
MNYTPLQKFFRMLHPNRREIKHLYIFAIASGLIALSLPLGIQSIINLIQGGEISASWILLVTIVILGFIFSGGLQVVQMKITEDLQKDIFARSAFEFVIRIPKIKMDVMERHYAPELMNRFFDTVIIQKGVAKILLEFTTAGLQILFGLILLSFYHSFLIVFSVLVIFIAFIIGNYIFKRGLNSSLNESKYKYQVAYWLEELARTFTTFKLESSSPIPIRNADNLVMSYLTARNHHFRILLRQYYLFIVFKVLVAAGFLILGGILVFNQQMNIGQFVAAEIIVLLIIQASEKILLALETVYDLLTSIEKISQVTNLELEKTREEIFIPSDLENGLSLEFRDVSFSYPDDSEEVIHNVSFLVNSNEKIGISGNSGSGKKTLIKLLLGFFNINKGTILYDKIRLDNYDINQLRMAISACFEEMKIFDGSFLENITMGKELHQNQVVEVLQITGLYEVLMKYPEGLLTKIGPHGIRLPGSVIQKLILARCLLKPARLYIIEDILKNVDKEDRMIIFEKVFLFLKDKTVVLITKDKKLFSLTEKTLELIDGKIYNN